MTEQELRDAMNRPVPVPQKHEIPTGFLDGRRKTFEMLQVIRKHVDSVRGAGMLGALYRHTINLHRELVIYRKLIEGTNMGIADCRCGSNHVSLEIEADADYVNLLFRVRCFKCGTCGQNMRERFPEGFSPEADIAKFRKASNETILKWNKEVAHEEHSG